MIKLTDSAGKKVDLGRWLIQELPAHISIKHHVGFMPGYTLHLEGTDSKVFLSERRVSTLKTVEALVEEVESLRIRLENPPRTE